MNLLIFTKLGLTNNREKDIKKFIIIFFIVGIIGLLAPYTTSFFKIITPLALIVNFFILSAYHKGSSDKKSLFTFLSIYFIGFFVEVIGVETGIIFGNYTYGETLGIKLFNTPLIIGVNWLFLCYVANSVFEKYNLNKVFKIFLASFAMLIYDIVLEQLAPDLDFWYWKNNIVSMQNYLAWFLIAFIFNSVIKLLKISTKNSMSGIIFISQFIFFLLIFIFKVIL